MSILRKYNNTTLAWEPVVVGAQGAKGDTGQSAQREARSDWVSPYNYIGIAAKGSAETSAVWKITRITISGTTVTTATITNVKWSDRLTATYT